MIEKLKLERVKATFNDLYICINKPLSEQRWEHKQDLLQLEVGQEYLIDVGYDSDCSLNGEFKIFIIKDHDWSNPIWVKSCKTTDLLIEYIQEAMDKANKKGK